MLSAWASNLLVREQPDEVQRLVHLGEALRQAHQDLDGEQLRELQHAFGPAKPLPSIYLSQLSSSIC